MSLQGVQSVYLQAARVWFVIIFDRSSELFTIYIYTYVGTDTFDHGTTFTSTELMIVSLSQLTMIICLQSECHRHETTNQQGCTDNRPIIGASIGHFANNWNRPIIKPVSADCYLLCIMMALDTEIIFFLHLNGRHKFSFYSYICKLHKHAGTVVFCIVMH